MTVGELRNKIIQVYLYSYQQENKELSLFQQVNEMSIEYLKKNFGNHIPAGEILEDETE